MKNTLLEIVQDILNDLDSDEVNSIDDTIESQQVANIVKQCYFELIANRNWPHLRKLITLNSSVDPNKPTHLQIPENMKELVFFNYDVRKEGDTRTKFQEVKYKYPDEFLRYVSSRNGDNDNVEEIVDWSGSRFYIYNDKAPLYWTSFDDRWIVCDAYDNQVDSTLQAHKTQVLAYLDPSWSHLDDAVPDLPSEAFPLLIEEAKSTASLVIKQVASQKAEQKATRQNRWLSRKAWRTHGGVRYQNYGRQSRK